MDEHPLQAERYTSVEQCAKEALSVLHAVLKLAEKWKKNGGLYARIILLRSLRGSGSGEKEIGTKTLGLHYEGFPCCDVRCDHDSENNIDDLFCG